MAVRAKIDSIERDISVIIDDLLSPEAQSKAFAEFARATLVEAESTNLQALGFVPPHQSYVDGRQSEALETVRPNGVIIFEFELLNDIFAWIGEQLVLASPVRTGRYSKSFLFLADGTVVAPGAEPPKAAEYVFVNTQPYARKIEKGLSSQAPDGVFQAVAALASHRFGNMASILFGYRSLTTGAVDDWANSASAKRLIRKHYRKKGAAEWLRKQPAIIIRSY